MDWEIDEDGKWQARWGKLICLTTQWYDIPVVRVGLKFVSAIATYLSGIWYLKWNAKRVIIFQTVILQRVRLRTGIKIFANELMLGLNHGTKACLMNLCEILTSYPKDTWGGLAVINVPSSITVHSLFLFCMEYCASPSDLFINWIQGGGGYYPIIWRMIKQVLRIKLLQRSWWKISARKTSPQFYIRGVRRNTYFYSRGYYKGCDLIDCMKTLGGFGTR